MNRVGHGQLSGRASGNGTDHELQAESQVAIPISSKPPNDWLVWQLADSAFPTGGFAHSSGLEAAWQHGEIRNRAELGSFIEASLHQFGHGSLPFMTAAHKQPGDLAELDEFCHVFLSNHVANRASRLQGQAMFASARRIYRLPALEAISPPHGHMAPVFGLVTNALGVELESSARLFIFAHLRGLIAAAVRLGIVGPMDGQTLQHEFSGCCQKILGRCLTLGVDDVAQTAPLQEIWQGAQDRLYSRLFQS